jgi:predicted ATP-grasp superfamily ATP-dependent carboligase
MSMKASGTTASLDGGRPAAIVIGLDCITGLQSARILAARNVPVIGIASDTDHFCTRTRSVRAVLRAETSGMELIDVLRDLGPRLSHKAVLYPCTDASVLLIARERERLEPWFHIVLPATDVLVSLMDKVKFLELAAQSGVRIPATRILRTRSDVEKAARELPFPCILKPALKTAEWERHSPLKVHRVQDGDDLLRVYDRYGRYAELLIVQQWIEGGDDTLYSCNCYYDRESKPVCTFIARKLRQWPPRTGTSSLGEEVRNDEVRDLTLQLFGHLGYHGLGYLEVKRDPRTGDHFVIEANPGRPTGRSAIAEAGGVPLLYAMYCETVGLPLPEGLEQRYRGAKWIFWRNDARSAFYYWRRGELSLRQWASSWRGKKASAVFSWTDPGPVLADIPVLVRKSLRRLGKSRATDATGPSSGSASPAAAPPRPTLQLAETSPRRNGSRPNGSARPAGSGASASGQTDTTDYDIHGILGVRLIDASPADRAAVERQLGDLRGVLRGEPDIVVRFVDRIPTDGLRFVEVNRSGFTDDAFLIRSEGARPRWVKIPFDTLGRPSEFICEHGVQLVPLLKPALRLAALQKGYVPFHASAFEWRDNGIMVAGWTHGGKTSALLAFADHGARFVGDDLVLLSGDGSAMFGMPATLRLSETQLQQLPRVRDTVPMGRRMIAGALRRVTARSARWTPLRLAQAVARKAESRFKTPVRLATVFPAGCALTAEPRTVFLMVSHEASQITVEAAEPYEIAERMSASLAFEAQPLLNQYRAFRFAFPELRNAAIEAMQDVEHALLRQALARQQAYIVRHPYPAPLQGLYEAMRPYCVSTSPASAMRPEMVLL